jgi:hypothetical protein
MTNTNLTNQRQVFVEEYVRSGDTMTAIPNSGPELTNCTPITPN